MSPDRGQRRQRSGDRFDYRRWAAKGFSLYDDLYETDEETEDPTPDEGDFEQPQTGGAVGSDPEPVRVAIGDQPPDAGERGYGEMADGEFYEPADHAGSDIPN